MNSNHRPRVVLASTAMALALTCQSAWAQDRTADNGATYGEIIVTAQKRAQNLQDVPLSISAFASDTLEQRNIQDLTAIGTIETGTQITNNSQRMEVTIRGIGASGVVSAFEQPVAVHIDGFYQARAQGALGSFFDVERVEVLKGPQGTLYGRNATGGAVNIIMKKPTADFSFEGRVEGIYIDDNGTGNGTGFKLGAVVNLPLSDAIQTRFSILKEKRDGYTTIINEKGQRFEGQNADNIAIRGQVKINLSDSIEWLLAGDYYKADDRSGYIQVFGPSRADIPLTGSALGGKNCGKCRITYSDIPMILDMENWGLSSTFSADLNDNLTFKSLTQYRKLDYFSQTDFDGVELELGWIKVPVKSKQFTQELQLNGDYDRLQFVLGAFYFRERIRLDTFAPFPILPDDPVLGAQGVGLAGNIRTDAWAIFGEATYKLTDAFSIVLGGRYSEEKKGGANEIRNILPGFGPEFVVDFIGPVPNKTFKSFTPKIGLNFEPTKDLLLYASFSKGFKSGGYNIGNQPTNPAVLIADRFNPEKIEAYEVGLKATMMDRKLQLNLAGFYYDYSQLQLESIVGNGVSIQNAGKAKIYGVDASLNIRPVPDWNIGLSGTLMHARYVSSDTLLNDPIFPEKGPQDIGGNHLPRAPEFSATINTDYTFRFTDGGSVTPSFTAAYKGKQFFSPFNQPGIDQKAYWWLNAAITYRAPDNRFSVSLYGDNLTNKLVYSGLFPGSALFGYQLQGITAPPRVIGLRGTVNF